LARLKAAATRSNIAERQRASEVYHCRDINGVLMPQRNQDAGLKPGAILEAGDKTGFGTCA
jgi:hypothetical protein